jgi:pSer/pThr/pTyr-binding forkhead associated (FHA) protein
MKYYLSIYLEAIKSPVNYRLEKSNYILGRHSSCDILILDKFVSLYHCTLVLMPPDMENPKPYYMVFDGVILENRPSKNGTWVNNKRIKNQKLSHQDTITFGSSKPFPNSVFYTEITTQQADGTLEHEHETNSEEI